MEAVPPLPPRQQRYTSYNGRHLEDNTTLLDEYSAIYSSRDNNFAPPTVNRTRTTSFLATARAARRIVVNGLIVTLIVAVAITFLTSICVGVYLLVKPSPSLPHSTTTAVVVTVPNNHVFQDDTTFSLQYLSTRNGTIHTDDDVFIMDRFPTSQPTRAPTVKPTASPITSRPTTAGTNELIVSQFRDSKKNTTDSTTTVTTTNSTTTTTSNTATSSNDNSTSKAVFAFDDDGKTIISTDDVFGNNIPNANIDDAALPKYNTGDTTTSTTSPQSNSFMDDVLNNVLATKNIDDTVKGDDTVKASNIDDSLKDVSPQNWQKQANFSHDDGYKSVDGSGDDFWNDVADDDKLKSESKSFTGGNFASFTASPDDTRTNDDGKRDDVLEQKNNLNGASSASNSASKASSTAVKGDDDLVKSIKETGTKTDKLSNSNTVQVKKVHNIDANANNADDDLTTSKDDENTLSSFKGSGATTNGLSYSNGFQVQHDDANSKGANCCDTNVDGKSGTDDFQNDNFLTSSTNLNGGDDFQGGTNKNSVSSLGNDSNSKMNNANMKNSATDDFQNDNFVASNTLSNVGQSSTSVAGTSSNKNSVSSLGDDSNFKASNANMESSTTDDFQNDNFIDSSASSGQSVGTAVAGANTAADDFQNDNFLDGNSGQSVGTLSAGEISSSGFAIGDDTSANFKAAGAGDAFAEGQSLDDEAVYSAPTATLSSPTPQPTVSKKASKKGKESSPTPAPSTKTVAADGTKSTSLDDFASGDDISGNFGTTSATTSVSEDLSFDDATEISATTASVSSPTPKPSVSKKTAKKANGNSPTPTPQPYVSKPSIGKKRKGRLRIL